MGRQNAVRQSGRYSRLRSRSTVRGSQRSSQQRVWAALTSKQLGKQLMHLLYHHSPLLVVGLWAILIGSAVAAWTSITDPDASVPLLPPTSTPPLADAPPPARSPANPSPPEAAVSAPAAPSPSWHSHEDTAASQLTPTAIPAPQAASPALRPSQQPTAPESPSPVLALWMLALSCATGCLLLFQWTKPRRARTPILVSDKGTQLTASRSQPMNQPSPQLRPLPEASVSTSMPAEAQPTSSTSPASISFTIQPPPRQLSPDSATPAQEVAVTIVPPEHSHPLDWNEPSLADSLDLRQRRPLSYWL